jgi:ArsR family transcriptional regulator
MYFNVNLLNNITTKKIEDLQKLLVLNRIRILEILYKKDTCVCKMVEKLKLKHNLISHHLKILSGMGYLESTRNGQHIVYKLVKAKKEIVTGIFNLIK